MLLGEHLYPARRWMDAQQQLVERQQLPQRNHDLAIQHEALGVDGLHRLDDVREVAPERLPQLRHEIHLRAIAKGDAAKAVPLGLVLPLRAERELSDLPRLHRRVAARLSLIHISEPTRRTPISYAVF